MELLKFGNWLFTLVLIIAAALTFISALLYWEDGRPRSDLRWLTAGLALGIPLQGVIGGMAVLTQLNPYVVGLHFLLSMVLISLAVWLVRKTWHFPRTAASGLSVAATRVTFVLMWLAALARHTWSRAAGRTPAMRMHRETASTVCCPTCTRVGLCDRRRECGLFSVAAMRLCCSCCRSS